MPESETSELDRLQAASWGAALQGDPDAIDAVLAIILRRAQMMGLDTGGDCAGA